jgi:hypothetical protein
MFDASLSHLWLVTDAIEPGAPASLTVARLQWDDPASGSSAELAPPLAVVANDATAETLRGHVRQTLGMAEATWRLSGGRAVLVGGEAWRLVVDGAQRLVPQPTPGQFVPLAPATDAACAAVGGAQQLKPASERLELLADGSHCLAIVRVDAGGTPPRDQVQLRAYARPRPEDLTPEGKLINPAVLVASVPFGRVPRQDSGWLTGAPGTAGADQLPFNGWLVQHRAGDARNPERWVGVPWSTGALLRLGAEVLATHRDQPTKPAPPGAGPAPEGAPAGLR